MMAKCTYTMATIAVCFPDPTDEAGVLQQRPYDIFTSFTGSYHLLIHTFLHQVWCEVKQGSVCDQLCIVWMTAPPCRHVTTATSPRQHPGGRCLPVSAAGLPPQQVSSCDAFQAQISIRSTHSSQPTRHTADPHMAPGPFSPPVLQSRHITRINFLTIPQGSIFRTCWNNHEVLVG